MLHVTSKQHVVFLIFFLTCWTWDLPLTAGARVQSLPVSVFIAELENKSACQIFLTSWYWESCLAQWPYLINETTLMYQELSWWIFELLNFSMPSIWELFLIPPQVCMPKNFKYLECWNLDSGTDFCEHVGNFSCFSLGFRPGAQLKKTSPNKLLAPVVFLQYLYLW